MKALAIDRRRELAVTLSTLPDHAQRMNYIRAIMTAESAEVETHTHEYRLKLLGRRASCTSSADGAIGNWIAATMKEAFNV